jgi:hypothetical protein
MANIHFYSCSFEAIPLGVNFADSFVKCIFNKYIKASSLENYSEVLNKDIIVFSDCIFNASTNSNIEYIYNDYLFANCIFNDSNTSSYKSAGLIDFGSASDETQSHKISIINAESNINVSDTMFAYLFRCRGKNDYYMYNVSATGRIYFGQTVPNSYLDDVLFTFSNNYYGTVASDLKNALHYSLIDVRTANGTVIK